MGLEALDGLKAVQVPPWHLHKLTEAKEDLEGLQATQV